jgi:hypothetical protein
MPSWESLLRYSFVGLWPTRAGLFIANAKHSTYLFSSHASRSLPRLFSPGLVNRQFPRRHFRTRLTDYRWSTLLSHDVSRKRVLAR